MLAKAHYILALSGCITVVIISNTRNKTSYWTSKSKKLGKPHGPRPRTVLRTDNVAGYWSFHCDTDNPSMVHQNRVNRHFC